MQQRKPDLTKTRMQERYKFANDRLHWTVEQWARVMFSDETIISRVGSFGRKYYYSSKPRYRRFLAHQVKETQQGGGGKIMVWGCLTYYGVGDACWPSGNINAGTYKEQVSTALRRNRDQITNDVRAGRRLMAGDYLQAASDPPSLPPGDTLGALFLNNNIRIDGNNTPDTTPAGTLQATSHPTSNQCPTGARNAGPMEVLLEGKDPPSCSNILVALQTGLASLRYCPPAHLEPRP